MFNNIKILRVVKIFGKFGIIFLVCVDISFIVGACAGVYRR